MNNPTAPQNVCYHGGAFFSAIGDTFDDLTRRHSIINADVLDAWFDPAPGVLEALRDHLPWICRTSPPTNCDGLISAIAAARGLDPQCILPGGGSSDLIFRTSAIHLNPKAKVLILDPMYGEYSHVLDHVIECDARRLELHPSENFRVDPARLRAALADGPEACIIVNPNSPTGQWMPSHELEPILREFDGRIRFWIDETYIDYIGAEHSLERFAQESQSVVICKSMSKVYALSGLRVAYLCARPHTLNLLRRHTPPWVVGLPGQVAAVAALRDPDYYATCYDQTHILRKYLSAQLREIEGTTVTESDANFVLCRTPDSAPPAAIIIARCRERGVFLRDASQMGRSLGDRSIRIAVKPADQIDTIITTLRAAMHT